MDISWDIPTIQAPWYLAFNITLDWRHVIWPLKTMNLKGKKGGNLIFPLIFHFKLLSKHVKMMSSGILTWRKILERIYGNYSETSTNGGCFIDVFTRGHKVSHFTMQFIPVLKFEVYQHWILCRKRPYHLKIPPEMPGCGQFSYWLPKNLGGHPWFKTCFTAIWDWIKGTVPTLPRVSAATNTPLRFLHARSRPAAANLVNGDVSNQGHMTVMSCV